MHLLLEGPAIEPLLARVRDEHGPTARIVKAERRRTGGVAGFFTKESFEVTVEVPDDVSASSAQVVRSRSAAAPLGSRFDAVDTGADEVVDVTAAVVGAHRPPAPEPEVVRPDWARSLGKHAAPQPAPAAPASGLHHLVAAVEAAEQSRDDVTMSTRGMAETGSWATRLVDPAPPVSTEGPAFAAVLAALHERSGEPDDAGRGPAPFAWPTAERPAPVAEPVVLEAVVADAPVAVPAIAGVLEEVVLAQLEAEQLDRMSARHQVPVEEVAADDDLADDVLDADDLADDADDADEHDVEAVEADVAAARPEHPTPRPQARDDERERRDSRDDTPDEDLETPRRRGRSRTTADEVGALLDVVAGLPPVPPVPHRAGYVTLVVGEAAAADAAGARVAEQLHLLPQDVVVVGRQRSGRRCGGERPALTSAEQVATARRTLRSGDVPAVVVVETGTGAAEEAWAADVLDALRADHVLAVVDAGRKAADVGGWLAVLEEAGCWVDALSVHGAARTSDPESVLDLGLPVAELDGAPAGPATWAALLLDRVTPSGPPSRTAPGDRAARRRTAQRRSR